MKVRNPIYPGGKAYLPVFLHPRWQPLPPTHKHRKRLLTRDTLEALALPTPTPACERTIKANVVALDQVIMFNRRNSESERNDLRA